MHQRSTPAKMKLRPLSRRKYVSHAWNYNSAKSSHLFFIVLVIDPLEQFNLHRSPYSRFTFIRIGFTRINAISHRHSTRRFTEYPSELLLSHYNLCNVPLIRINFFALVQVFLQRNNVVSLYRNLRIFKCKHRHSSKRVHYFACRIFKYWNFEFIFSTLKHFFAIENQATWRKTDDIVYT